MTIPSWSYVRSLRRGALSLLSLACDGRGGIRTAGEAGQPRQRAAECRRVSRTVLRVHYHVDYRVYTRTRVQEQVAYDVEHCNST